MSAQLRGFEKLLTGPLEGGLMASIRKGDRKGIDGGRGASEEEWRVRCATCYRGALDKLKQFLSRPSALPRVLAKGPLGESDRLHLGHHLNGQIYSRENIRTTINSFHYDQFNLGTVEFKSPPHSTIFSNSGLSEVRVESEDQAGRIRRSVEKGECAWCGRRISDMAGQERLGR